MNKNIVFNGKEMPFSTDELIQLLKVVKHAIAMSSEDLFSEEDTKTMDSLIKQLNSI